MIQLRRERTAEAIPVGLRGQQRTARERQLLRDQRDGLLGTRDYWKKRDHWKACKTQLRKEASGKCAYCESPAEVVAKCDVDHFRPKSQYWWLAYCYDNYVYACQECNRHSKGDHFPVYGPRLQGPWISEATTDDEIEAVAGHLCPDPMEDPDGPILSGFAGECRAERAALRDPYGIGDPGAFFLWRADADLGEVEVYPRDASELAAQVFDAANKHLGINRESLKKARWDYAYRHLWTLKELLEELDRRGGKEAARRMTAEGIQAMMGPRQPYAGMVRYFVQIEWRLSL